MRCWICFRIQAERSARTSQPRHCGCKTKAAATTVTAVVAGELRFKVNGEWRTAVVGEGFADITRDFVLIAVDTVERPEDIDVIRAREAKERAEERLHQKQSRLQYYHTQAALSRAMARLKVTSKYTKK